MLDCLPPHVGGRDEAPLSLAPPSLRSARSPGPFARLSAATDQHVATPEQGNESHYDDGWRGRWGEWGEVASVSFYATTFALPPSPWRTRVSSAPPRPGYHSVSNLGLAGDPGAPAVASQALTLFSLPPYPQWTSASDKD